MNQNAQMVDESLVDLETGEVLDALSTALADKAVIEDMPRYARALRTIEARMDVIRKYRAEETERIQAICDQKTDKFEDSKRILTNTVEGLMKATGKEQLDYPGIGAFKFGLSRESVNTDKYDALPDDEKDIFQSTNCGWFRKKTYITPDKKKIKATLDTGEAVPGFSLNRRHETFTFKVEK